MNRADVCCPRNGKQVPQVVQADAATVFAYHCAHAWEGRTATLASPDTGQKVEGTRSSALLFNLAYGDVGRLSTKENISCAFQFHDRRSDMPAARAAMAC